MLMYVLTYVLMYVLTAMVRGVQVAAKAKLSATARYALTSRRSLQQTRWP